VELTLILTDDQLAQLAIRVAVLLAEQQQQSPDDGYLDSKQAAEFLGAPLSRIHDLVGLGKLHPLRDGRALRFRRCDLRAYLEQAA
jgi:excisionase family DNA binding protein